MTCESAKCYSTAIYTTIMVVLSLQLLGTIEKQVFDFLGYMWAPIIGNFFQIICTILGIFGTYQYRPKFIAVYSTWSLIWLGWNIFVICLYLEVGVLNRNKELYILTMGTKTKSWWLDHGIGCRVNNESWIQDFSEETGRLIPPEEFVEGCILEYYYVEVIHAGVQCLLALTGFVFSLMAIYIYGEEQDSCKYPMSARTYISPKDYPSTRYAPIDVVQQARHSWCLPTHVTYSEAMTWGQPHCEEDENVSTQNGGEASRLCAKSTGNLSFNWSDKQTVINMDGQFCDKGNNSYTVSPKGDNLYQDYQTCTRMRNCDTGSTDQNMYVSKGHNSASHWSNSPAVEKFGTVSPV